MWPNRYLQTNITGQSPVRYLKDCCIRFRPRTESHNLSCRRLLSCNRKQTLWDSVQMCSGDRYNASNIGLRVLAGRDSKGRYSSHPSRSRAQMKLGVSSNWKREYVLVGYIRQNCSYGLGLMSDRISAIPGHWASLDSILGLITGMTRPTARVCRRMTGLHGKWHVRRAFCLMQS